MISSVYRLLCVYIIVRLEAVMVSWYVWYIVSLYVYLITSVYISKSAVTTPIESISSSIPVFKSFNSSLICLCISSKQISVFNS
uniref:Uncharacterized protein n=1 Tax=virus sp. ctBM815 TaxID=2825806 RepID=A0A8S5RKA7_9VIRU|nr:MAG TPA: hypothetical protein [virus sp. ctBM815]